MSEETLDHFKEVLNYIDENLKGTLTLDDLASYSNMSKYHFSRIFKELTNYSPIEYIRRRKLCESLNHLLNTDYKIIDIALEYGFQYEQSYIRSFISLFNISPDKYRKERPTLKM